MELLLEAPVYALCAELLRKLSQRRGLPTINRAQAELAYKVLALADQGTPMCYQAAVRKYRGRAIWSELKALHPVFEGEVGLAAPCCPPPEHEEEAAAAAGTTEQPPDEPASVVAARALAAQGQARLAFSTNLVRA